MNKISVKTILIVLSIMLGCKDDDGGVKFEGILLRSLDNLDLGTIGKRDINDWQDEGQLSKQVLDLLATMPDHDLTGTTATDVMILGVYPNPVSTHVIFRAQIVDGPCLFQYVIVNDKMKVLLSGSQVGSDHRYTFDVSNESKFPNNTVVRMYYSFSKEGEENFYVGHGDILICHSMSTCRGF